jgi:hypothetical protein
LEVKFSLKRLTELTSEEKINLDWLKKEGQMSNKKFRSKEIAEASEYVESMRKQAPPGNEVIVDSLDELKGKLSEMLLKAVLEESKRAKKH